MTGNKTVFFLIGVLLVVLGLSMLAPYSIQVIYKENSHVTIDTNIVYILKISGIWESNGEIGITYKLFESNSIYA